MSLTTTPAPQAPTAGASRPGPAVPPVAHSSVSPAPRAEAPGRAAAGWSQLLSATLATFSVAVLALALVAVPLGALRASRAQDAAYQQIRQQLGDATAPLNPPIPYGEPVAVLSIPKLGLRDVVFEGTTGGVLRDGPGHRADSVLPGQVGTSIVYGRALTYGAPFREITSLTPGESFTVTTAQGDQAFQVERIRRPGDPLPPPLAQGQSRLILATAEGVPVPDVTVFVDARLVGQAQQATPHVAAVPPSEKAFGVDLGSLLPLVLLLPVLLGALIAVILLRNRWGRTQGWLVGAPVLAALSWAVGDEIAALLPNLV